MFNKLNIMLFFVASIPFGCLLGMEGPAVFYPAGPYYLPMPVCPVYYDPATVDPMPAVDLYERAVFGDIATITEAARRRIPLALQRSVDGWTLAHIAAVQDNVELMGLLLAYGANVSIPDLKGNTPLHMAFLAKNTGVALCLIRSQFEQYRDDDLGSIFLDLFSRNWEKFPNQTPLDLAYRLRDYYSKTIQPHVALLQLDESIFLMEKLTTRIKALAESSGEACSEASEVASTEKAVNDDDSELEARIKRDIEALLAEDDKP